MSIAWRPEMKEWYLKDKASLSKQWYLKDNLVAMSVRLNSAQFKFMLREASGAVQLSKPRQNR